MGNIDKLNTLEAIALVLIIVTNQIILNLPNSILTSTGSSAVLNSIYISLIAIVFTFIVYKLFKKFSGKDLLDVSKYLGGNTLKFIVGILYVVFFTFITSILLRYFCETLKIIYFNDAPIVLLVAAFLIPPFVINKFGLNVISKVVLLFIPILLISMIFLAYTSLKNFDTSQIFPVFGYGTNQTFIMGLTNLFSFGGLAYIYFLKPLIKENKSFGSISIISIALSGIFLILSVLCLLMLFPFIISTDETLSIYLITKTVELGRFIQRIDAIFVLFWIFATLCYISVNIFFVLNILKKIIHVENPKEISFSLTAIIFSIALFVGDIAEIKFLERYIYKYSMLILIFGISFLILILANIKHKKKGLTADE